MNEHVITHELGHCIGFRHSDYYDRSISCGGSASNEGASNVGAIHIPGTPTTAGVGGSIMNSCFRSSESGEWSSSDRTALYYLYSNPIDRSESFIRQVYLDVLMREPTRPDSTSSGHFPELQWGPDLSGLAARRLRAWNASSRRRTASRTRT